MNLHAYVIECNNRAIMLRGVANFIERNF